VRGWLSGEENAAGGLYALEAPPPAERSTAATDELAWWPLLHGGLFSRADAAEGGAGEQCEDIGKALERRYPAGRMGELFRLVDAGRLARFVAEEPFHTEAIRCAWQICAERVLAGSRLPAEIGPSRHGDEKTARRVTALLEAAHGFGRARAAAYPERLVARVHAQDALLDPWATAELQRAALGAVEQIAKAGSEWMAGLTSMPRIDLDTAPVVIVLDGVAPDVWLAALNGLDADTTSLLTDCRWYRLSAPPRTADALAALFGFSGDTLEETESRGIPYLAVAGNEEQGLLSAVRSSLVPETALVVRVAMPDRAAHAGGMRLSGMAEMVAELSARELPGLLAFCRDQGRHLILTTDHGMSLGARGLSHGGGGIYEEVLFRVEWSRE
jgi:hypothetical protein